MKLVKRADLILIAVVACAGLILWAYWARLSGSADGLRAEIYYRSELMKTVDLTAGKEESFSIDGVPNVVFHLYEDGSIAFVESDCPDQICVRTGRLRRVGQMAACLPNRLYIKIVGPESGDTNEPDIIIG